MTPNAGAVPPADDEPDVPEERRTWLDGIAPDDLALPPMSTPAVFAMFAVPFALFAAWPFVGTALTRYPEWFGLEVGAEGATRQRLSCRCCCLPQSPPA